MRARLPLLACSCALIASLVLGGGTRGGFLSDAVLQLIGIPILILALWSALAPDAGKTVRRSLWVCLALVGMPLLQLVPLPAGVWSALPGREVAVEGLALVLQKAPSQQVSLSPSDTWLAIGSLIPPIAVFLAVVQLSEGGRRRASLVLLVTGVASLFLGLLQVAQGPASPLRFYEITNLTEAVGFFANRNHFAALLYCLLPIVAAWAFDSVGAIRGSGRPAGRSTVWFLVAALCFAVLIALVAAQAITRSRAGMGLTMIALLAAVALAWPERRRGLADGASGAIRIVTGAAVVASILAVQFSLLRILERFEVDRQLEDARVVFSRNTIAAAKSLLPVGSGVGTFVPTYAAFEPASDVAQFYANRAHSDIAEGFLEGGIVTLIAIVVFVGWLAWRTLHAWRPGGDGGRIVDRALPRAATVILALLIAHSFVDYPLRTGGMMAIFAFAAGLLVPPPAHGRHSHHHGQGHSRASVAHASPPPARDLSPKPPAGPAGVRPAIAWPQSPASPGAARQSPAPAPVVGERWGADVAWPEAWREKSNSKPPAVVPEEPASPATKKSDET